MSLWTPSGEHPVGQEGPPSASPGPPPGSPGPPPAGPPSSADPGEAPPDVEELRRQLAEAPAEVVVANHCYGLFELAAVYLSQTPPLLAQAQLAIDALGYLVDGLGDRLGELRGSLTEALAQIRLAYVELDAAEQARQASGNGA
jgi:hypothetical protein